MRADWGGILDSNWIKNEWGTTNTVVLITNGVGEGKFGMMTVFCRSSQTKIEACNALSALHQSDSLEMKVAVVRRYSNTPYIPRGMSHSLFLDVGTLQGGISSTLFPLHRLHLHW